MKTLSESLMDLAARVKRLEDSAAAQPASSRATATKSATRGMSCAGVAMATRTYVVTGARA